MIERPSIAIMKMYKRIVNIIFDANKSRYKFQEKVILISNL